MAMRLTNAAASAAAGTTGLAGYIGSSPKLTFYTGSVPASAEDDPAGTALGTVTISQDFGAPSDGVIQSSGGNVEADDSGTVGCWALFKTDGTTKVADGTVAEGSGGDINFDETAWVAGGTISMGTLDLEVPPH
jgi:hypothetical protein